MSDKIKRDYSQVDDSRESQVYSGEEPKNGFYDAVVSTVGPHTSGAGNESIKWTFDIVDGEYAGWRGWVYTNDDSAAWKEFEVMKAIGLVKDKKDGFSGTYEQILKKAKPVRIRIRQEPYEGEQRAKIRSVHEAESAGAEKVKTKKSKGGKDPFA